MGNKKRRDNKGRILRSGESQCKDGRYRFTYREGEKYYDFYSWKLEETDRTPEGKKESVALRKQIEEYRKKTILNTKYQYGDVSVLEIVERYLRLKNNAKVSTKKGYKTVLNYLKTDPFSKKLIKDIRISDAKIWLVYLQSEVGKSYSAIHSIRGVIRPAFQSAVEDDIIPKNPFNFELSSVLINDSVSREAISPADEAEFLRFIKNDNHFSKYYEGVFILFKTGLRISEFCGLTIKDIDFKNKTLSVSRQLIKGDGGKYIVIKPKTDNGERKIPLSNELIDCFRKIIDRRRGPNKELVVQGVEGFLYLDKNRMPVVAYHWEKRFKYMLEKYNKTYKNELPKITPHVCRHTFCTNMAKSGVSPKTLQYLMGHSEIGITMNVYTHIKFDDAKEDLKRLNLI